MPPKIDAYRATLRSLDDWEPFLLRESGLPGPRGNLELAAAVAEEGDDATFRRLLRFSPQEAPVNSPGEFLVFCGVAGLGRLAPGQPELVRDLRTFASDPRWRVREAVAVGLQYLGDADLPALLATAQTLAAGGPLERRAAVAGLCEPRLLRDPQHAGRVLALLDSITSSLCLEPDRRAEPVRVLRQALGYGWSVAIVALPDRGRALFEKWAASPDPDVRWIVKSNLGKTRLHKMDAAWVAELSRRVG